MKGFCRTSSVVGVLLVAFLAGASPAVFADRLSVGVGVPGLSVYLGDSPGYVVAPQVVYPARPIYYAPPPVYYAPEPVWRPWRPGPPRGPHPHPWGGPRWHRGWHDHDWHDHDWHDDD